MKKIYNKNNQLFAELNYSKEYYLDYSKHSHETFAIGIIGSGGIEVQFHTYPKQYLYPKQIVIFNPNHVHSTQSKIENTQDYYTLHINKQWCKEIQTKLFGETEKFVDIKQHILDEENLYGDLIRIFQKIVLNEPLYENEELEEIISYILKKYHNTNNDEKEEESTLLLKKVEKYILDNTHNQITLEDIALEVGYNEAYITRVFKKKFGLSPHAFLINKRVSNAKNELLKSNDINLAQLSLDVGFYDQSHFSKVFKRVFAMSPHRYKNGRK